VIVGFEIDLDIVNLGFFVESDENKKSVVVLRERKRENWVKIDFDDNTLYKVEAQ
jgi:hypothetical protein